MICDLSFVAQEREKLLSLQNNDNSVWQQLYEQEEGFENKEKGSKKGK